MAKWISACPRNSLPRGAKTCLDLEGTPVVLYNVDGQIGAMLNVCPHAGLPLGDGDLVGKVLICPYHGYTYDTQTGRNADFDNDVPATILPVRISDDGAVEVNLKPEDEHEPSVE
jgi:3-phenylpropionate/trans-cinnamate dioxygenase ferredoxin component